LVKDRNNKIWVAIKWLATYIAIRPKEMLAIKENDFDFNFERYFKLELEDVREIYAATNLAPIAGSQECSQVIDTKWEK